MTVFLASCLVAIAYLWLFPSFATTSWVFEGRLGWTSRGQLAEEMAAGRAAQAVWRTRLTDTPLEDIENDDALRRFAIAGGRAAFNENCAPCHGVGAGGQIGQFPSLVDDDWLWGGTLADIPETVRYGIRSGRDEARLSEMPAFGELMTPSEIGAVADYVLSLSAAGPPASGADAERAALFEQNCAACHGLRGGGNHDLGAPRLDDAIWLYGGGKADIERQIAVPRIGG